MTLISEAVGLCVRKSMYFENSIVFSDFQNFKYLLDAINFRIKNGFLKVAGKQ